MGGTYRLYGLRQIPQSKISEAHAFFVLPCGVCSCARIIPNQSLERDCMTTANNMSEYLRIYNDRHYINDVVAGACIGVISTKLAYWLYPKIFTKSACRRAAAVTGLPYYFSGE